MRGRKGQTRETLSRGVYGGGIHCINLKNGSFLPSWIQILLLSALNLLLNNKPG